MVTLTVIDSAHGAPEPPIACRFSAPGGTIGRAADNALVLPDSERSVSRVHARVQFRGAGPKIICLGANPISVNGTPLEQGEEAALGIGDRVQIGAFLLKAEV